MCYYSKECKKNIGVYDPYFQEAYPLAGEIKTNGHRKKIKAQIALCN